MKYIIKNIKSFIKTEKMVFLLVLLCVVTSSFIINFSYGLYQNYNVVKDERESDLYEFPAFFKNSETGFASVGDMKKVLLDFSEELNEAVDMYLVSVICDEFEGMNPNRADIRFCIKNGNLVPCELFKNNITDQGSLYSGRYFSEQEEINGERVAIVSGDKKLGIMSGYTEKLMLDDETILFQGNEYKIIGSQTFIPLIVPFNSLKDDTPIFDMIFHFKNPVTRSHYNEIKEKLEMDFGGIVEVPELDIPETESYYLYNTIILVSIFIAVLAAINFAVLYKYVLSKRTKTLAVFRMCGCTKLRAFRMFLGECMFISIPAFALTTLIYDRLILPKLGKHYVYIQSAYSPRLYLLVSAIYILASVIVLTLMILRFLRKSVVETKGE